MKSWKLFLYDQEQEEIARSHFFFFNKILEVTVRSLSQEKDINGIQIRNKEVKLSLFTDDLIMYIENPKDTAKKYQELLELINSGSM